MGNPSKRDKSILKVIYTDFAHKKWMILLEMRALSWAVILIGPFEAIETYIHSFKKMFKGLFAHKDYKIICKCITQGEEVKRI